jgi:hypothetical protein
LRLKEVLAAREFTRIHKILFCLAADDADGAQSVGQIRTRAASLGLRAAAGWNISDMLRSVTELAIRTAEGWELTSSGQALVRQLAGVPARSAIQPHADALRALLPKIGSANTVAFVEEAIGCAESKHYRAAVVLAWVGAVAVLYDHVVRFKLAEFNSEALRRNGKWKEARTVDDLARLPEYDFLQIAEAIGVFGKNTKQELEGALKLRNACGHPSSLRIGETRAAAHVETLVLNVYAVF